MSGEDQGRDEEARLSKLLFEAREAVEMYSDVVARQIRPDPWLLRLLADIDAYRAERGWSPHGFGGEGGPPVAALEDQP